MRNVEPWSSSAPRQCSSPHGGCYQGCSPDLAPSDYYLFSKLKKDLQGRKFDDEEEVKTAVMEHFADKEPEYFLKGIELPVHRCEKCV